MSENTRVIPKTPQLILRGGDTAGMSGEYFCPVFVAIPRRLWRGEFVVFVRSFYEENVFLPCFRNNGYYGLCKQ
jgi:hypothetical protein